MARVYKQPSIVSGLKIKDILNMDVSDFNKLGKKDLQKITGRLVSAANKRYRRATAAGVTSPAFSYVEKTGVFSTKGKNINQLRAEFVRAKNFLEAETSTIKGAEKFVNESIKALKNEGVEVSRDNFQEVMRLYESLKRDSPKVAERGLKYAVLQELSSYVESKKDPDDILTSMQNSLDEIYEREQENLENEGVSGFFTIDEDTDLPPF